MMIPINRFIPFAGSILILIGLELINFKHPWLYWLAPLMLLFVFFSVWRLAGSKFDKKFLRFLIGPFLFTAGIILFFIVLTPQGLIFRHLYIFVVSLLLYLFLKAISKFLDRPNTRLLYSLENVSGFFNLIIVFLFFSIFCSFVVFSVLALWLIEIAVVFLTICLVYQALWANEILNKKNILFIFITALILAELFLAVSFLPTSFYVNGLFLTIIYYLLIEITRSYLLKKLNRNILKRCIIIVTIVFLIIILTTRLT